MADLAFIGVALPLIIDELTPVGRHQLVVILDEPKTRATQSNAMSLAECAIRPCAVDLIGADLAISAAIGSGLWRASQELV